MTDVSKTQLKSYFETGKVPTQNQFADLIDSLAKEVVEGTGATDFFPVLYKATTKELISVPFTDHHFLGGIFKSLSVELGAEDGDSFVFEPSASADPEAEVPLGVAISKAEDWNVELVGRHAWPIPAGAFTPDVTTGAERTTVELAGGRSIEVFAFDSSSAETISLEIPWGSSVKEGTLQVQIIWTHATSEANGVVWEVSALATGNGDALDEAASTAVSVSSTGLAAVYPCIVSPASGLITPSETWEGGDTTTLVISRNPAAAGDTLAQDACIIGVRLFYETETFLDE